ncbi:MAG: FMN-binding protein [Mycobacteriales bacterium]
MVSTRRNATVALGSLAGLGLLMLYPTSTGGPGLQRPGARAARVGVVAAPSAAPSSQTVVNGRSVDTAYGPVQVQLVLRAGRVLRATAIDYPQGSGVDQQINSYAIPLLQQETVATQGSRVDTVSGATYTSDGYRRSLQSALDAAHRA